MKKLIAITLNCLIFLTASGSLFADNVLLFGDRPGDRAALKTSLEGLGHTVTDGAALPVDLSGFDTVWHVGAFVPLPPGDQAILATYLASGGGVHLTGERPCCEDLNDSLENFINTVVVGGGVQVGDLGDINGPYAINPAALNGLADTPNTVSLWSPSAPGGMGGLGNLPDANILTTGAGDVPVGGAWAGGDLVSGDGQLTLLMDVNWFSSPLAADNLAFVDNIQTFLNGDFVPTGVARFLVTKTFSDGRDDEVEVTLTCNTGLPLEQDFMIAGGDDGVMFVVTNLLGGDATCEVTESGGPDGYTTIMNGGNGCTWEGVEGGVRVCEITNVAQDATFTVYKDWDIINDGGDAVVQAATVTIHCNNPIDGGTWDGEYFTLSDTLVGDGASLTAEVDTTERSAECWADENQAQSGVVADTSDCGERTIVAGGSSSCRIMNTVFFEGIPTLSQYGLAIMALLMLGVGFIGFRRFV